MKKIGKNGIIILLLFTMIVQMIVPNLGMAYADEDPIILSGGEGGSTTPSAIVIEPVVPTDHLKVSVLLERSGNLVDIANEANYRPQNGDNVKLKFDIIMEQYHSYGEGSTLTYILPDIFTGISGGGSFGDPVEIATYQIVGNELTITFTEEIRDDVNQGLELIDAYFQINAKYSLSNTVLEYELELPGRDKIILNFKPVGGNSVEKKGTADNGGKSSNKISWTVDINTELNNLINATFSDELLLGNHTYDQSSLKVHKLDVNAAGQKTVGDDVTSTTTPIFGGTNKNLSFALQGGKQAYRITYDTIIDKDIDSENASSSYKNKATLINNGTPTSKESSSVTVIWGKPLEKIVSATGGSYGSSAEWTIKYNYNRRTIEQSKATITDKITGYHKIESVNDIKVWAEDGTTLISNTEYTVVLDEDSKGFTLQFNNNVTAPYQIKYTTVRTDLLKSSGTVSNKVTRGNDTKEATNQFNYSNPAINKIVTSTSSNPTGGVNYKDKTIEWEISVNRDNYTMNDVVITDTYSNEFMKFKDGSMTVKIGSVTLTQGTHYTFVKTYSSTNPSIETGFKIELIGTGTTPITNPLTGELKIRFKTDYTISDVGSNERTFNNKSDITWTTDGNNYSSSSNVTANIDQKQIASGSKKGVYNYETKEFKWTVLINFNSNTLTDAVFKDLLPIDQQVNKDSILVRPVTLNNNGSIATYLPAVNLDGKINPADVENSFEIELGTITGPYEITYTSVDKDGIIPTSPKPATNLKVKNQAELWSNSTKNSSWEAEVTVEHTRESISKFGSGVGNTSKINWNFKLNYSQSILRDVKIIDTVGKDADGNPNQFILGDTFKIYEVTLKGESASGTPDDNTKTLINDGYTLFIDNIAGKFEITFDNQIEKAYYIEYQTIFLGAPGSNVANEAELSYTGITSGTKEKSEINFNYNFTGSGSTKKLQLKLIKVDEDNSTIKLENAVFELYNSNGIYLTEATTDEYGVILYPYKIGAGIYKLKEKLAPTGYVKEPDFIEVNLKISSAIDGIQTETITNGKIKGSLEITKKEKSGTKLLQNAEISIHKKDDDEFVVKGTTGGNGIVKFDNLPYGEYYFIETIAPEGYVLNDAKHDFEIKTNGEIVQRTLENEKIKGSIEITKKEKSGIKLLSNTEISIYTKDDIFVVKDITDVNGIVKFDNLPYGEYYFKETKEPEGYVLDSTKYNFKIETNDVIVQRIFENEKIKGSIEFKKEDMLGNSLEGAKFGLYDKSDSSFDTKLQEADSGLGGIVEFNNVPYGEYKIKEIIAPLGYLPSTDVLEASITVDGAKVVPNQSVVKNEKIKGDLQVIKLDKEDNSPLAGAEFELVQGGVVKYTSDKTGSNGIIVFRDLDHGDYILREKEAPNNYRLSTEEFNVSIVENGKLISIEFKNEKKKGTFELTKIDDETKRPLKNAEISIYKEDDTFVVKAETDISGKVKFELPIGKYYYQETKAPYGYEKKPIDVKYYFEITHDLEEVKDELTNKEIIFISPDPGPVPPAPEPPKPEPTPEPEPKPEPQPERPPVEETTDPEKPVDVTPPNIPENSKKEIVDPPKHGKIEFREDGKWTYTPEPVFIGKDKFTVKITNEDGEEEIIIIEVDVIPGGPAVLPDTGEESRMMLYVLGFMSITAGITLLFKRKKKKEKDNI